MMSNSPHGAADESAGRASDGSAGRASDGSAGRAPRRASDPDPVAAIERSRVVGIVREHSADDARAEITRLVDSGVAAVEVSLGTPGALEVIEWMAQHYADREVCCGAGTVVTARQLEDVVRCGATFVVSPISSTELVHRSRELGVASVFGAMTPTECVAAAEAGSDFVKLFPARQWSPTGMRDLLQALPDLRLVPTGGVSLENAAEWLDAGAVAVGLGSSLRRQRSVEQLTAELARLDRPAGAGVAGAGVVGAQ